MNLVQTRALIALSVAMVAMVGINLALLQKPTGFGAPRRAGLLDLQAELAPQGVAVDTRPTVVAREPGPGRNATRSPVVQDGDIVRVIQRELAVRQYAIGPADGVPGLMTRAAILAFEFDHGQPLTAEPSQALLKAILIGAPGTSTDPARMPGDKARQLIATVQASLAALGYARAGNDGRLGDPTRRAIREFEMDRGLPRSGRVSPLLIQELAKAARRGRMNGGAKPEG